MSERAKEQSEIVEATVRQRRADVIQAACRLVDGMINPGTLQQAVSAYRKALVDRDVFQAETKSE